MAKNTYKTNTYKEEKKDFKKEYEETAAVAGEETSIPKSFTNISFDDI